MNETAQANKLPLKNFETVFMGKEQDMAQEELAALVEAEEQRLGVGSKEFMDRHNEIMQLIERCQKGESHG